MTPGTGRDPTVRAATSGPLHLRQYTSGLTWNETFEDRGWLPEHWPFLGEEEMVSELRNPRYLTARGAE